MKFKTVVGTLLKSVLPVVAGLALLVLVVAWLAGVTVPKIEPGHHDSSVPRLDRDRQDDVYEVREVTKEYVEEALGTLKAASRTVIAARVLAPIDKIPVRAGQTVEAGSVLVELDRRALETQLSQAKASLAAAEASLQQAKTDHDRAVRLFPQNAISRAALDQSATNVEVAGAELKHAQQATTEAEVMLSYTTIKAPKDGMIVDRLAEPGDMARPGEPLLIIYDPTSLRLEVPVMENLAIRLKPGDTLVVQIDALDNRQVQAVIDEIVPQAEAASRSFLIKVKLPRSEDLFEGMFGRLRIPVGTRRHLCLHTAAIDTIGQLHFVDVVGAGNTVERRFIKVGRFGAPDHREVLSGLKVGDRVLLKPQAGRGQNHDG